MITFILFIIAAMFSAAMDVLKTRYKVSIFSTWKNQNWVNPALSWPNKWKPKSKFGDLIMSTILVWVTDFWHLCKFIMLGCIMLGTVLYTPLINFWADFLILWFSFGITFELFYSKILIKKS